MTEVEKYKLYNKLRKQTQDRPSIGASNNPPRTPSPPRLRPVNRPTAIIASRAHPATSATSFDTKNPFSPVRKRKSLPDEPAQVARNPFMTPVKSAPAPVSTSSPEPTVPKHQQHVQQPKKQPNTIVSKARKRLRGDSVSPSPPRRDKHIQVEGITTNTKLFYQPGIITESEKEESFIEESPAKPTANGKTFQPLFNDISSQPSTSTEHRGRAFMKAKTIPGGLFGAVRDTTLKDDLALDYFPPVGSAVVTKGKGKAIDGAANMHTSKKRKTLPGPTGLIPTKDNLFGDVSSSTAEVSSRKRPMSGVVRDTADKSLESNVWNLLPPSPPAQEQKLWKKAKKQKLVEKVQRGDGKDTESDTEVDDVDIVSWHEASSTQQLNAELGLEVDPELRIQLHLGALSARAKSKSPEPEIFDVDLPEHMVNMLSLSPRNEKNEKEGEDLVKGVIQGRRRGGAEVWGPGEFGGESEGSTEGKIEEQDDWESEGIPWEVGEL